MNTAEVRHYREETLNRILAALTLLVAVSGCGGDDRPDRGSPTGRSSREPGQGGIADVTVTDTASLASVQTEGDGDYFLAALPRGETCLRFSKTGYESLEIDATQAFGDAALQRVLRVRAGDKMDYSGFAPNDITYMVGGERCFPCRLVRVTADAPATFHFRVTWAETRAALNLWANGSVTAGSTSELEADVPVPRGESIVYLGMKTTGGVFGLHVPFTIEATVR